MSGQLLEIDTRSLSSVEVQIRWDIPLDFCRCREDLLEQKMKDFWNHLVMTSKLWYDFVLVAFIIINLIESDFCVSEIQNTKQNKKNVYRHSIHVFWLIMVYPNFHLTKFNVNIISFSEKNISSTATFTFARDILIAPNLRPSDYALPVAPFLSTNGGKELLWYFQDTIKHCHSQDEWFIFDCFRL